MRTTARLRKIVAVAAVGFSMVTTLSACGSGTDKEARPTAAEGREYLEKYFSAYGEGASFAGILYRTLDETLPNVTFVHPDAASNPNNSWKGGATTHVIVGNVTDVQPGKGFWLRGDDAPDGMYIF